MKPGRLVLDLGIIPVVPPKSNRLHPWDYYHAVYKKRNESNELFRTLKGFRDYPPELMIPRPQLLSPAKSPSFNCRPRRAPWRSS